MLKKPYVKEISKPTSKLKFKIQIWTTTYKSQEKKPSEPEPSSCPKKKAFHPQLLLPFFFSEISLSQYPILFDISSFCMKYSYAAMRTDAEHRSAFSFREVALAFTGPRVYIAIFGLWCSWLHLPLLHSKWTTGRLPATETHGSIHRNSETMICVIDRWMRLPGVDQRIDLSDPEMLIPNPSTQLGVQDCKLGNDGE